MALRPGARAWAVWSVALAAYVVAVLHRTSFGIAGPDAQSRFGVGPGALASFAVLQLLSMPACRCRSACCWTGWVRCGRCRRAPW
jgi:hypothetical protein